VGKHHTLFESWNLETVNFPIDTHENFAMLDAANLDDPPLVFGRLDRLVAALSVVCLDLFFVFCVVGRFDHDTLPYIYTELKQLHIIIYLEPK